LPHPALSKGEGSKKSEIKVLSFVRRTPMEERI
jgi:hypothetical protein